MGELSLKSEAFRTLWARHDVRARTSGTKTFTTPLAGRLTLHYQSFSLHGADRQTCYTYVASPARPTSGRLRCSSGLAEEGRAGDRRDAVRQPG